jgi:hypothetical protein
MLSRTGLSGEGVSYDERVDNRRAVRVFPDGSNLLRLGWLLSLSGLPSEAQRHQAQYDNNGGYDEVYPPHAGFHHGEAAVETGDAGIISAGFRGADGEAHCLVLSAAERYYLAVYGRAVYLKLDGISAALLTIVSHVEADDDGLSRLDFGRRDAQAAGHEVGR